MWGYYKQDYTNEIFLVAMLKAKGKRKLSKFQFSSVHDFHINYRTSAIYVEKIVQKNLKGNVP